ncbi:MAG: 50S ribosomal protein L17 [Candidatus Magasanikbacteria bacterium]
MSNLKKGRKLGRDEHTQENLLQNLANNLIFHENIKTTEAKAKELQPFIEKMITTAKKQETSALKELMKELSEEAAYKLYHDIAPNYEEREGGYTRIIKHTSRRKKDGAKMATIEFV